MNEEETFEIWMENKTGITNEDVWDYQQQKIIELERQIDRTRDRVMGLTSYAIGLEERLKMESNLNPKFTSNPYPKSNI